MSYKYYLCGSNKNKVFILNRKQFFGNFRIVLVFSLLCCVFSVKSQYLSDVGLGGGVSGYTGELSRNPILNSEKVFAGFYRSNLSSRFALRLELEYGHVGGSTLNYLGRFPDTTSTEVLDYSFRTRHISGEVLFETNFFPYPKQIGLMKSMNMTPFAFIGLGAVAYNSGSSNGFVFAVPFGAGVRWAFADQWGLQAQFKANKLFTDAFDGEPMNNPFNFDGAWANQDWLYTSTISLTFSFGEDLWDCNCPKDSNRDKK